MKEVKCPYVVKFCEISPADAAALLSTNFEKNRRINRGVVDKYIDDIKSGVWSVFACDPVYISDTGKLLNGQHRMTAIVRTGISVNMELRLGIPETEYASMDQGKKRTAGDAIGVKNQNEISALCRVCMTIGEREGIERKSFETGGVNARHLSNTKTFAYYEAFEEKYPGMLEDAVKFSKTEAVRHTGWTATAFAVPYLAIRISSLEICDNFKNVVIGEDNSAKSVLAFKTWQVRNNKGRVKKGTAEERYIAWSLAARVCEYIATGKDGGYQYKKGAVISSRMPFFYTSFFALLDYQTAK